MRLKLQEILLIESKYEAINSIQKFITQLGLNPKAYNFLYDIEIRIDYNLKNDYARYNTNYNTIFVNADYLKECINEIKNDEDIEDMAFEISHVFVHEMIHATRTIMIENGLILVAPDKEKEIARHSNNHDIDQYYRLLDQIITKDYIKELKTFIPIKITKNPNNTYTIIAYNQTTNEFHEFKNQTFKTKLEEDYSLYKIGLELNDPNSKHETNDIIKTFIPPENSKERYPYSLGADQYYHPYSKTQKIIEQKELENHKLERLLQKKEAYFLNRSNNAKEFEESITEAIALIIMIATNKNTLDLESITKKIIEKDERADVRVAANLINHLGMDFVQWFLTSSFEEYYDDKLEKTFKDKYDYILEKMNMIYQKTFDETVQEQDEEETNKAIDEIFSSIKR